MAREELISSASKNLTQEEIDIALARVGEGPAGATAVTASSGYQPSSQPPAYRGPPPPVQGYGYGYPPYGQWQPPPPEYVHISPRSDK
ncbi:hypothetical protein APSETT444_003990 [Aspergillus pseudonomiae]